VQGAPCTAIYYELQPAISARATHLHEDIIYVIDLVLSYPPRVCQGPLECLEGPHFAAVIGGCMRARVLSPSSGCIRTDAGF
jgi:hypothetical protein